MSESKRVTVIDYLAGAVFKALYDAIDFETEDNPVQAARDQVAATILLGCYNFLLEDNEALGMVSARGREVTEEGARMVTARLHETWTEYQKAEGLAEVQ